ncbi:MAG: hypothetical protein HY787_05795 [Deltaproteobacteria bacterium]|nr:hypothetical protein [Deltaproteobacteria bacterium]
MDSKKPAWQPLTKECRWKDGSHFSRERWGFYFGKVVIDNTQGESNSKFSYDESPGGNKERKVKMIGMDFISFIILLVISIVVAGILHFVFKFYIMPGWLSYVSKVIIGWVGAWLGSPVFGYWWKGLNYKEVYIVPAILGSLSILIFAVDFIKTRASVFKSTG